MGGGCDWVGIGWKYNGGSKDHATSFLVSYAEAEGAPWPGSPPSQPALTTTSQQMRITGLRAGVSYEIRVAAVRGTDRSGWATAPSMKTDRAREAPEPPLAPSVLGSDTVCHVVRLRLPTPQVSCRSPTDATLQLSSSAGTAGTLSWQDYEAPFSSNEMELADLKPNASYRFRLIAHNAAGRSHPGTATGPVHVCDPSPEALAAYALARGHGAGGAEGPRSVPLTAFAGVAICATLLLAGWSSRRAWHSGISWRRAGGASYERASTDGQEDEIGADSASHDGAYDAWAGTLCVHVFVPASSKAIQIEMSTKGIGSTGELLRQLRLVVSEVAGRQPPLAPEELSVIFEDVDGMQSSLDSGCGLHLVYKASRVVASVNGARVSGGPTVRL